MIRIIGGSENCASPMAMGQLAELIDTEQR